VPPLQAHWEAGQALCGRVGGELQKASALQFHVQFIGSFEATTLTSSSILRMRKWTLRLVKTPVQGHTA
jgi:hypothetical protein